jgi:hypothetical protein
MAVILLLAAPAGTIAGAARSAHASVMGRIFAEDRVITSKRLAWIFAPAVVVLILVARRHILHQ